MDHFDRIYTLHSALRRARYPVSTTQLCEELECSPATLRRIVSQLREELGAPIGTSHHDGGGYWYAEAQRERYELPGLWFNPAELLALTACLQLLHEIEPGILEPTLAPLRERITGLLETHHLGAGELHRIRILGMAARINRPEVFRVLAESVLVRRRLAFRYRARSNNDATQRAVSPQRLTRYRDNWYLDAWDHGRRALRIFSVDRIDSPQVLLEAAKNVPQATLDRTLVTGYGIFAGVPKHTAILRFTPERARWVADERWHPQQRGRFLEDGRYELCIPYADARELIMDILKQGPDVEVTAPRSLRQAVAARLQAGAQQYARD